MPLACHSVRGAVVVDAYPRLGSRPAPWAGIYAPAMSDTVLVAIIVGLAGIVPAVIGVVWGGRRQVEHEAMRDHAAWGRERRYEAAVQLIDSARSASVRTYQVRLDKESGALNASAAQAAYRDIIEPMSNACARLTALGPPDIVTLSTRLAEAGLASSTAALRHGRDEMRAADAAVDPALIAFAGITHAVLGPPIEPSRHQRRTRRQALKARAED